MTWRIKRDATFLFRGSPIGKLEKHSTGTRRDDYTWVFIPSGKLGRRRSGPRRADLIDSIVREIVAAERAVQTG